MRDFKEGSFDALLEKTLDEQGLMDVLVALETLCMGKANLIKAGLQDGAHSPELGRKWRAAEKRVGALARWAGDNNL